MTVLGFINGLLSLLPGHPILFAKMNDETGKIMGYGIKKRWW